MARTKRRRAPGEPPTAEIVAAGDSACLVRLGEGANAQTTARVHALLAALDTSPPPGLRDLVPAYASLLAQFDPLVTTQDAVIEAIQAALARSSQIGGSVPHPRRRLVGIPVRYGGAAGPDLEEVARLVGLTPQEVAQRHAASSYGVAFLGFLAGFPYLSGLPSELAVPRLATPRTLVPAGSVAIAGGQTGIYPVASPGGWRVIGHTDLQLFDPAAEPPALLRPGDRVRFVPLPADEADLQSRQDAGGPWEMRTLQSDGASAAKGPAESGALWLRVLRPGLGATVQDLGRWGYARYGVSASGAADPDALRLGNLLLGNPPTAAALEIPLGAAFEVLAPCCVALTGAECAARVDGRPLPPGVVAELLPGRTLELDLARTGLRAYLCVAGGVAVAPLLGSHATDLRAGFGGLHGRALRAGDELRRGDHEPSLIAGLRLPPDPYRRAPADGVQRLRVLPGPHAPMAPDALRALLAGEYIVDPRSDRMGVRLQWHGSIADGSGDMTTGVARPQGGQVVSEGVPRGAIQLPPDGEPILLLAEHQTTGGYLIPAVVIAADHWRVGQLRPGDRLRLALTTMEQAIAALRARAAWLAQAVQGYRNAAPAGASRRQSVDPSLLARGFAEWDEATDATMNGEEGA